MCELWLFAEQQEATSKKKKKKKLIIHNTEMVPLNAEHNLGTVNIRSGRQRGGMSGHSHSFEAF